MIKKYVDYNKTVDTLVSLKFKSIKDKQKMIMALLSLDLITFDDNDAKKERIIYE